MAYQLTSLGIPISTQSPAMDIEQIAQGLQNVRATAARSRVRVTARRIFDTGESDNPATIIKDVWNNPNYGMNRPLANLFTKNNGSQQVISS